MPPPAYVTEFGTCYHADGLDVLRRLPANSVALAMTSPPFALRRQKAYGNVTPAEYVEWFWPFAREVHLVLRLCEIFHLAQEFYWYNPSRLPTPAEWVTIRRTRVKDAVNMLWWLSKTTEPQADNRRVLKPYSRSMKRLLRDGYDPAMRPSQHEIGPHFQRDNGGAIPPNLLEIPNTRSNDDYLRSCRAAGLPVHPARFPPPVPEFFVRFLTEPGQTVLDPFAGSNVTGQVAQGLDRRWVAVEVNGDYVAGSMLRFPQAVATAAW